MRRATIRIVLSLLAATVLMARPSGGQPIVFRDDFNGTALGPHWLRQPGITLEVGGGELRVTRLTLPPGQPDGRGAIGVNLAPLQDYRVTTRFDVPPGLRMGLVFSLVAGGGTHLAQIEVQYDRFTGETGYMIVAGGSDPALLPPPPPGYNEYTLRRIGGRVEFELNGVLAAVLNDRFQTPIDQMRFEFVGTSGMIQPARRVDYVEIIPSPGPFAVLGILGFGLLRRPARRARP
ncbi:MAG: hypothetical protein FJ255_01150 [Phycisphaerae bacterium]|nr:hypothetical protein [Phycisphaerae bacterium]